jgi:hypothetical protein
MEDAREKIETWRRDYNEFQPHGSPGDLAPRQFIDKYTDSLRSQEFHFWLDQFSGEAPEAMRSPIGAVTTVCFAFNSLILGLPVRRDP